MLKLRGCQKEREIKSKPNPQMEFLSFNVKSLTDPQKVEALKVWLHPELPLLDYIHLKELNIAQEELYHRLENISTQDM